MSYEGYVQCICSNGHRFDHDCYYQTDCPCGAGAAFENPVDQTNGDNWGYISDESFKKFLISDMVLDTCPTCQHHTVKEDAKYRIPTNEERKKMRTFYEPVKGMYWPCGEE